MSSSNLLVKVNLTNTQNIIDLKLWNQNKINQAGPYNLS